MLVRGISADMCFSAVRAGETRPMSRQVCAAHLLMRGCGPGPHNVFGVRCSPPRAPYCCRRFETVWQRRK